ncbi:MFS transporter [Salinirubellus salinus]|uniref:MFS transporter n=1 Tax=Salinirubellus salinus TaxID=1364945 RepID=A0A9E7R0Y2_9EURY|nr:MFS transporter [Salinirubellus salinus]UWM52883.1 MFS transporter [Salinirubellus salinus]
MRTPGVVTRYYLYEATDTAGFVWPVFTLFLLSRGLSFTEIATLSATMAVLVVVGEVPTGYLGDRIGRRNSLVLGRVAAVASLLGFLVVTTFPGFLVLYALWALTFTFASGTAEAWLYDTLEERLDTDQFTRVRGRGRAVGSWAMAATMVASGFLYVGDREWPFVAAAAVGVVSVGVLLTMPEPSRGEGDEDERLSVVEALPVVRGALGRPGVRSLVLYVGLFYGAVSAADDLIQPIAVDAFDGYLAVLPAAAAGLPGEALLGFLYAGFTAVAGVASDNAGRLESALGTTGAVVVVPAVVAVCYLFPLVATATAVPVFFVLKAGRAAVAPVTGQFLNDRVESVGRATALSAAAMVFALVRVPLKLLAGGVADAAGPVAGVAALGVAFLLTGGVLVAVERPGAVPTDVASHGD